MKWTILATKYVHSTCAVDCQGFLSEVPGKSPVLSVCMEIISIVIT